MNRISVWVPLVILLLVGCAAYAEKSRMNSFDRIAQAYEHALRVSDYSLAAKFLDPSASVALPVFKKLKNIKIVDYKTTHIDVSEDRQQIQQDVELQYFLLDSHIIRHTKHPQTWRYREKDKVWLLESGLPDFGI